MQSPQWFFIILHLICIIFFFFFPFLYHPALFTYTRWDHIRKLLRTSFSIYLQFLFYFLQNNYVSDTVSSHFSSVFFVCVCGSDMSKNAIQSKWNIWHYTQMHKQSTWLLSITARSSRIKLFSEIVTPHKSSREYIYR